MGEKINVLITVNCSKSSVFIRENPCFIRGYIPSGSLAFSSQSATRHHTNSQFRCNIMLQVCHYDTPHNTRNRQLSMAKLYPESGFPALNPCHISTQKRHNLMPQNATLATNQQSANTICEATKLKTGNEIQTSTRYVQCGSLPQFLSVKICVNLWLINPVSPLDLGLVIK